MFERYNDDVKPLPSIAACRSASVDGSDNNLRLPYKFAVEAPCVRHFARHTIITSVSERLRQLADSSSLIVDPSASRSYRLKF
jgi:hypothetical protein